MEAWTDFILAQCSSQKTKLKSGGGFQHQSIFMHICGFDIV